MTNPDKVKIRRAFALAAESYDDFAHLQRTVAIDLLQKSGLHVLHGNVLDIGCGTGYLTQHLHDLGGYQHLLALDLAQPMLHKARQRLCAPVSCIAGDAECLPLRSESLDFIFSSLAVQWCQDLPSALREFQRVLKPGGYLAFATFGAQTLMELKQAWVAVDHYRHINEFCTLEQLQTVVQAGGWQTVRLERQVYRSEYTSVMALMWELKGLGAHSVNAGRKPRVTSRAEMQQMCAAYPVVSATGRIIASFEVIWVFAGVSR